jgi:hypothetical protein
VKNTAARASTAAAWLTIATISCGIVADRAVSLIFIEPSEIGLVFHE